MQNSSLTPKQILPAQGRRAEPRRWHFHALPEEDCVRRYCADGLLPARCVADRSSEGTNQVRNHTNGDIEEVGGKERPKEENRRHSGVFGETLRDSAWLLILTVYSVIDDTMQYFIAESSRSVDLNDTEVHAPGDNVWMGCSAFAKTGRICVK